MSDGTWQVRCYIEYEVEASNENEAILRLGQCILDELEPGGDIRDIAEVTAEKISDTGIDD